MTVAWEPNDRETGGTPSSDKSDLCETAEEAQQHIAGGRSWQALKENKTFDTERVNESPLFRYRGLFEI